MRRRPTTLTGRLARQYGVKPKVIYALGAERLSAMSEEARAVLIGAAKHRGPGFQASRETGRRLGREDCKKQRMEREIARRVEEYFRWAPAGEEPDQPGRKKPVKRVRATSELPRECHADRRIAKMLELARKTA